MAGITAQRRAVENWRSSNPKASRSASSTLKSSPLFQEFSDARQRRLSGVITAIPPLFWQAVLIGGGLSIQLMTILRIKLLQHFVLGSITALCLGVILFVITTLDRPLRGQAALEPEPFETLWNRSMVWGEPAGERF